MSSVSWSHPSTDGAARDGTGAGAGADKDLDEVDAEPVVRVVLRLVDEVIAGFILHHFILCVASPPALRQSFLHHGQMKLGAILPRVCGSPA